MSEVRDRQLLNLASHAAKPAWLPADAVVLATNLLLAVVIVTFAWRIANATVYLGLHALAAGLVFMLAAHDGTVSRRSSLLTVLHHWLPAALLLVAYFELGLLIPQVHPFADYRYDRTLQAIDVWLLGDPAALVARLAWAPLSDLLTLCYVSYYPLTLAMPVVLYARGSFAAFERAATIILVAFVLTYAGYFLIPAIGPHRLFDGPRASALEGYGLARQSYELLRTVPGEPPDAFPSGHTLIAVLVPALAYRWHRPLFPWFAAVGGGIVLATIYLRFHYLADVLAAFLLAPMAWKIGTAIHVRFR